MKYDEGLPFILKPDNVARYEDGRVIILDRRKYPQSTEFVNCATYRDVARAIFEMVTQSMGPWLAVAYGMVSAAHEAKTQKAAQARETLLSAADVLAHARPTTSAFQERHIRRVLDVSLAALERGEDIEAETLAYVQKICEERYLADQHTGAYTAALLPQKVNILTQCFAETFIGYTLLEAQRAGKEVTLHCPETRPYLQGARLTASMAIDMGVPTTVITDNMPAFLISQGKVDVFICAADVITLDGYVVNKVGTFQIALAAHYHKIPFYALRDPSAHHPTVESIEIEERNPEDALSFFGQRTVKEGIQGWYPAFDITPPHLVSAIVTSKGVYSPWDLKGNW